MDKDEVICISSDDDENIIQNKCDNAKSSCIKQSKYSYTSKVNVQVSIKEYNTEPCEKKRKLSEIISENEFSLENKPKVLRKNDVKCNTTENSDELKVVSENSSEETLLKPKLVIKEKKTVFLEEQDIFPMFISLCLQKDHSADMKTIVNKLKRRYEQLNPTYATSETFINLLNEKRNDIMFSKNRLYVHIAEVMNEMKRNCKQNSSLLLNNTNYTSNTSKVNINNNSSNMSSNMSQSRNTVVNDNKTKLAVNCENEKYDSTQKKIKLILKAMKKCEKYIKRLEESEVDFDDENNSTYMKLEKFKHRMVELYYKYCQYMGENADAGRQYLRPKHFSTTGIVSVDNAITSFINSKIPKKNKCKKVGAFTDALIFPDYEDILECVKKCNELHNLGLDNKKQQQIAKKAFTELGEYLQRSRRNDYWDTFSLYLENKDDDPALKNPQLAEKLTQNKKEGEKRLENIFEVYVKKQEEMKYQSTDTETLSECEENEKDCMESEKDCVESEKDYMESENDCTESEKDSMESDEDCTESEKEHMESKKDYMEPEKDHMEREGDHLESKRNHVEGENKIVIDDMEDTSKDSTSVTADLKISTDEVQNGTTESETVINKIDINVKPSVSKIQDDIVEVEETDQTVINNELKHNISTSLTLKQVDDNVNISKLKDAHLITESEKTLLPDAASDELSTLPNIVPLTTLTTSDSKIPIEIIKEDEPTITTEKSISQQLLEEDKPLLRVRSFAKLPGTWKGNQEKHMDKSRSETLVPTDVIDLTKTSPKQNSTAHQENNVPIKSKVLPSVKSIHKTLVIPSGKNVIKVKNITNNFLRMNSKCLTDLSDTKKLQSEMLTSVNQKREPTIIRLPTNQHFNRKMNNSNQGKDSQTNQSNFIVKVPRSAQVVLLLAKQNEKTTWKSKTDISTSQSQ